MKIMVKQDLRGLRFGRLTVVEEAARRNKKHRYWLCLCDCGRETIVESSHLRSGHTKSCGCYRMELPREQRRKPMKTPPDAGRQEELRQLRRIATGKTYVNNTSGQRGVYRKGNGVEKDARKGAGPGIFLDRPRKEAYTKIYN